MGPCGYNLFNRCMLEHAVYFYTGSASTLSSGDCLVTSSFYSSRKLVAQFLNPALLG